MPYGRQKVWNEVCLREKFIHFRSLYASCWTTCSFLFHEGNVIGSGYSYGSLNGTRSAFSAVAKINGIIAGQNEVVCLFMKSSAKQLSKLTKGNLKWDPDFVLNIFGGYGSNVSYRS